MTSIDLTPIYRNSIGFDRLASLLDTALSSEPMPVGSPAYNIEATEENQYSITLSIPGFDKNDIDIQVENGVLTVRGKRESSDKKQKFLYQGISLQDFERKFNLADYIEVTGAEINNGLLTINLVKEIPEAMKPRKIVIGETTKTLEHQEDKDRAA
jgi:molecular chaperone IbpA